MSKVYGSEDEGEEDEVSDDSDEAPELITSRDDFEALMDDFLENHEVVGRKLKPVLPGDTAAEKLDTLRRAIGVDSRVQADQSDTGSDDEGILMPHDDDRKEDRWDCETILCKWISLTQCHGLH
jgi:protein LTV1